MPPSPTGPLYPGTAADGGGGGIAWTSVNNAKLEDGSQASSGLIGPGGGGGVPNQLNVSNFGFNIPASAIIDGIKVEYKVQSFASSVFDNDVHLIGSGISSYPASTVYLGYGQNFWPTSLTWLTLGGSNKLWGRNWTPAEINNSAFGVSLSGFPGTGTGTISVDAVRITVYWHTAPADVPKRYLYKVYDNLGAYVGNLPNVISEFAFPQDINTAGAAINVECAVTMDSAALTTDVYTDQAGNPYTDEAGSQNYTTEGQLPPVAIGTAGYQALIKNGNRVVVWEYSYYYPNGIQMFSGQINNWAGGFGAGASETVKILILSDSLDLDNLVARGAPFTYATDQGQLSQNSSETISEGGGKGSFYNRSGQSFRTGAVSNVGAITLMLNGTANVTVKLWSSSALTTLLGSVTQAVSVGGPTAIQFGFPVPIVVSPSTLYFFSVEVDSGQSILIYYQNTDAYVNGTHYNASYAGGSGGGSYGPATGDLYFQTGSSTGSTTGTYSSVDPSTGMLKPIIDDYRARSGVVNYGATSVDATGLSLTVTFNTETILDAIKRILSVSPSGFYFWVDLGTNTLYFKKASTTADIVLTKGRHLETVNLKATIENVKNQELFSGGATGGVNLYRQYQDQTSIDLYGIRLDRKSDNRVTVSGTADAIGNTFIANNKDEQFQTTVTILDKYIDITTLTPGKIIGFNGFGNFVDNLLMQIVRREYSPHEVSLTLGVLPKRMNPEMDRITRELLAQQTVANPTAPS